MVSRRGFASGSLPWRFEKISRKKRDEKLDNSKILNATWKNLFIKNHYFHSKKIFNKVENTCRVKGFIEFPFKDSEYYKNVQLSSLNTKLETLSVQNEDIASHSMNENIIETLVQKDISHFQNFPFSLTWNYENYENYCLLNGKSISTDQNSKNSCNACNVRMQKHSNDNFF